MIFLYILIGACIACGALLIGNLVKEAKAKKAPKTGRK